MSCLCFAKCTGWFWLVVTQAAAAGCPSIVSNNAGASDI